MSVLNCHTDAKELTVGQTFLVECQGDFPKAEDVATAQLIYPTAAPVEGAPADPAAGTADPGVEKYRLKFLKSELKTPQTADFQAVSYLVGDHSISNLKISMAGQVYDLSGIQFKVNSVIETKNQQEAPKPFPPFGPAVVGIPMQVYVFVIVTLVIVLGATFGLMRFFGRRSELRKKLLSIQAETPAGTEYFLLIRKIRKEFEAGKMPPETVMRMVQAGSYRYFSRVFQIWFDETTWIRSAKEVANLDLRMTLEQKQDLSKQIHGFLTEVQTIRNSGYVLMEKELENIFGRALSLNEKIEKMAKVEEE